MSVYIAHFHAVTACVGIAALGGMGCGSAGYQPKDCGTVSTFIPPAKSLADIQCGGRPVYDESKDSVISYPDFVKVEGKVLIGLQTGMTSWVRVAFEDDAGTLTNSRSIFVGAVTTKAEFPVPVGLKAGKYKLVVTFEDANMRVRKVEKKDIRIGADVTAELPIAFPPGKPVLIQNVKVVGQEKLEGVSYVIQAIDKAGVKTELAVADQPGTIEDKNGKLMRLQAPGGETFQMGILYKVTLKGNDGDDLWSGSFEIRNSPPPAVPLLFRRRRGCIRL